MKIDTDKLKNHLRKSNISYAELSKAMGCNDSYISNLISGDKGMSTSMYKLLCMTLDVEESTFLVTTETRLDRIERKLDELLRR